MEYKKTIPISLKKDSEYREKWLQDKIIEDPGILGLGEALLHIEVKKNSFPVRITCYKTFGTVIIFSNLHFMKASFA